MSVACGGFRSGMEYGVLYRLGQALVLCGELAKKMKKKYLGKGNVG